MRYDWPITHQGGGLKRFLPVVPVLFLTLLNACGSASPTVPPNLGTAVAQTQTAVMWTPTVSPTFDPSEPKIVEWLNAEFSAADSLEQTLDARYQVVDVFFPIAANGSTTVFRVDVRCECANYTACCLPERIFVVTMWAMKKRQEKILEQVPGNLSEVKVVCFDRLIQIGVVSAWWPDARGYMLDEINGYQLGARVFRSSIP